MPNNYSRNTYDRHPEKIERNHLCPLCGAMVLPFLGVLGTEHKGHCPKCGTVTYVSMPETVTHEFTSFIRAELDAERRKAMQIVLDMASASTPKVERKPFDEYMKTDYITEKQGRAAGWKEWKEAHPNSSPYHF